MNKEIWKDIPGYEGYYQVSNLGNVKSLPRKRLDRNQIIQGKILSKRKKQNGYIIVTLSKDSKEQKCYVHRLVAQAFIPNYKNCKEVNHIDENKLNNSTNNLEWCDRKYNCNYGTRNQKRYKEILQYDLLDNFIKEWDSLKSIKKYFNKKDSWGNISACLTGRQNTAYGYKWKYKTSLKNE